MKKAANRTKDAVSNSAPKKTDVEIAREKIAEDFERRAKEYNDIIEKEGARLGLVLDMDVLVEGRSVQKKMVIRERG